MGKELGVIESITEMLKKFALEKFPVKALEVRGPIQEGSGYRWRIVSTRYKEVTIVLQTSKSLFGKLKMQGIEIYGTTQDRRLKPNLADLQVYLENAELIPV